MQIGTKQQRQSFRPHYFFSYTNNYLHLSKILYIAVHYKQRAKQRNILQIKKTRFQKRRCQRHKTKGSVMFSSSFHQCLKGFTARRFHMMYTNNLFFKLSIQPGVSTIQDILVKTTMLWVIFIQWNSPAWEVQLK